MLVILDSCVTFRMFPKLKSKSLSLHKKVSHRFKLHGFAFGPVKHAGLLQR